MHIKQAKINKGVAEIAMHKMGKQAKSKQDLLMGYKPMCNPVPKTSKSFNGANKPI